jgi:alcohol dehydrogenase
VKVRPDLAAWVAGRPVYSGPGSRQCVLAWLQANAPRHARILVITGAGLPQRGGPGMDLIHSWRTAGLDLVVQPLASEPTVAWIDAVRATITQPHTIAAIISLGGGSVLDAGKALAALVPSPLQAIRHLEAGGAAPDHFLPWIALPTTGGTGSEATLNAVLGRPGPDGFKKSLRNPHYRPALIALDGELMRGLPHQVVAASGLDALTQLLESYLSAKASPPLQALLLQHIAALQRALPAAVATAPNIAADCCQILLEAAFASGVGLANAGLGTVHGCAALIGAVSPLPHGLICARLLGPTMQETANWLAAHQHQMAANVAWTKLATLAGSVEAIPLWVANLGKLADQFNLPYLHSMWPPAIDPDQIAALAPNRDNPADLDATCRGRILRRAIGAPTSAKPV